MSSGLPLSNLELILGVPFALLILNAARRGFLREGSLLLGLGLAFWAAGRAYRQLDGWLPPAAAQGPWPAIVYAGLTLTLLLVAVAVSALAVPLVRAGPLRLFDRLGGLAVGVAEATLVVGLLATAAERLGALRVAPASPAARSVEFAAAALAWLAASLPPELFSLTRLR